MFIPVGREQYIRLSKLVECRAWHNLPLVTDRPSDSCFVATGKRITDGQTSIWTYTVTLSWLLLCNRNKRLSDVHSCANSPRGRNRALVSSSKKPEWLNLNVNVIGLYNATQDELSHLSGLLRNPPVVLFHRRFFNRAIWRCHLQGKIAQTLTASGICVVLYWEIGLRVSLSVAPKVHASYSSLTCGRVGQ